MNTESPHFKKILRPGRVKGNLIIETEGEAGKTLKNSSKEKYISADLLDNLKSLAVMAEADPKDSMDQEWLNKELDKLKKKIPTEQPQEVWRRTLATLMAGGVDIESVAVALLTTNKEFRVKNSLGDMSDTETIDRLKNLKDEILIFWPSSPNLA